MKLGSLFSGYGGLEQAVNAFYGSETAWVSDIDPGACKILAHHHPDVPNLGDITNVDWATVEPVDILTGGFPCQDLSHAGKRAGLKTGTRSGLWSVMADAIEALQPKKVVIENVRGILSADAHSDVEPCPWCLGDTSDRSLLRALGCVLGDLADLGYDAQWHGLRAADIGAPHNRFRVFITAHPRSETVGLRAGLRTEELAGIRWGRPDHDPRKDGPVALLPTPTTRDYKGQNQRGDDTCLPGALLPTPRATDGTKGGPNQRGSKGDLMLPSEVNLLPAPTVSDSKASGGDPATANVTLTDATVRDRRPWGDYGPAIERWESITRPAPSPTIQGKNGGRLNPVFVEWMMGLPAGHVTSPAIGLTINQQLKALGNGVVPAQAYEAIRRTEAAA